MLERTYGSHKAGAPGRSQRIRPFQERWSADWKVFRALFGQGDSYILVSNSKSATAGFACALSGWIFPRIPAVGFHSSQAAAFTPATTRRSQIVHSVFRLGPNCALHVMFILSSASPPDKSTWAVMASCS